MVSPPEQVKFTVCNSSVSFGDLSTELPVPFESASVSTANTDIGSMPSSMIRASSIATILFFILRISSFIVCFVLWKRIYIKNGTAIGFSAPSAPAGQTPVVFISIPHFPPPRKKN